MQLLDLFPDMPYVQSGLAEGKKNCWEYALLYNNTDKVITFDCSYFLFKAVMFLCYSYSTDFPVSCIAVFFDRWQQASPPINLASFVED